MDYAKQLREKKNLKIAKDGAEKTIIVDIDINGTFEDAIQRVTEQTGYKNLLAGSIAGGLLYVGWRACCIGNTKGEAVKTFFVREDLREKVEAL